MNEAGFEVVSLSFWGVAAAALLVVAPLRSGPLRSGAFAVLNSAFLVLLLGPARAAAFLLFLLAGWWVLGGGAGRRFGRVPFAALAALFFLLFAAHKAPTVVAGLDADSLNPLLAAVGFSFVFLRGVDLGRHVFEGGAAPERFSSAVNYLVPFHMLAAGPIQSYTEFVKSETTLPVSTFEGSVTALERIASGLFKKYVLAAAVDLLLIEHVPTGGWYGYVRMNAFLLWLYLDFSAYSDIAIGVGGLMGVGTPENFRNPLAARNMIDFWERWHITLGDAVRRHLYFPIQIALLRRTGGAHPLVSGSIAFVIAFSACGLWHRVSPEFFAWGLVHATGLIACYLYGAALRKRLGPAGMARYQANPIFRSLAQVLTYNYVAASLTLVS